MSRRAQLDSIRLAQADIDSVLGAAESKVYDPVEYAGLLQKSEECYLRSQGVLPLWWAIGRVRPAS